MDSASRLAVRRLVDREKRRRLAADLDQLAQLDTRAASSGWKGLAPVCYDAANGDPELAVAYALDAIDRKRKGS